MEERIVETIMEYGSFILILGYLFIKYVIPFLKDIKAIFGSKDKKEEKAANNININLDQTQGAIPSPLAQVIQSPEYQITLRLLLQQAKIQNAMHTLKSDILKEQMENFRKMIRPIRLKYTEIICEILNDVGIENIYFGTYFTNSENFIEVCGHHIESTFRQMCKANHFTEKSNTEFRELVETNIFIIDGLLNELLMKRYPQRQLLKDIKRFDDLRDELRENLRDCFEHARDIAFEKQEKVEKTKHEFEDHIFRLTGTRYSLDL